MLAEVPEARFSSCKFKLAVSARNDLSRTMGSPRTKQAALDHFRRYRKLYGFSHVVIF